MHCKPWINTDFNIKIRLICENLCNPWIFPFYNVTRYDGSYRSDLRRLRKTLFSDLLSFRAFASLRDSNIIKSMKHQIKMIVTDLDGTLLRSDKTISENTLEVLNRCRKSGIKVVYATGRGGSAEQKAPAECFDARISMNGAIARIGNDIVYSRLISYKTARPLLVACDKRGLKITSEISGMHYSNFDVSAEWPDITNFEIVFFTKHSKDAEKIYSVGLTPEDVDFVKQHLPCDLHMVMARDNFLQIMHRDATKSKAASELARIWKIPHSQIAAFGDDLNDIDMLKSAGLSVAMENALDEVKAAADYICKSNDHDGLAEWITHNIF